MGQINKVAFITGANKGIGFETAKELSASGVHVIIGSRTQANGEKAVKELAAKGFETTLLVFDVTKTEDYKKAYDFIDKKFGKLDILVNNAGIIVEGEFSGNNTSRVTSAHLRETFDANFFGAVELTQTLLPLIKKSSAGRIVNLSSILGSLTLHTDPTSPIYESKAFAYDASKTALNAFTVHLAHELKNTNIKVNSAHPGWVKTDMGGEGAMMEVSDGAKTSVQLALLEDNGPNGGYFHMGQTLPW
jgi:NAD(P)-dependent dehydrogenase (short-subunit alcohol dehydrogenase family)